MHKRLKHKPPSLISVVQRCNLARVRRLIAAGADVNVCDSEGHTVLMHAAAKGRTGIVRLLLKHGADVHCRDNCHESALYRAIANHHQTVVNLLFQKGADLTDYEFDLLELLKGTCEELTAEQRKQREEQESQWETALEIGDIETLQRVLDAGLGVNYMKRLLSALTQATIQGHVETVRFLIPHIEDVNLIERWKPSALGHAIANNHQPLVEYLVQIGAALTLYEAALLGDIEAVRAFLDRGEDVNQGLNETWTPLHAAVERGHAEVIRLLLKRGAERADLLLGLAVHCNHHEAVIALLEDGADVNLFPDGTLLNAKTREMSLLLLQHGADVNARGNCNYTALMWAAEFGQLDQAQLLLEWGAEIEARDRDGNTALMFAAYCSQSEMVSLLLRAGADVHAVNRDGQTALQWVRKSRAEGTLEDYVSTEGDEAVIALLKQAGAQE